VKPETSHVTGLGVGGMIIINMHLEGIEWEGLHWINLAQDMNKWILRRRQRIFGLHTMCGISFLAEKLETSQKDSVQWSQLRLLNRLCYYNRSDLP
jgi:hypothetical protein